MSSNQNQPNFNKALARLKRIQEANKMYAKPITLEIGNAYMKYFREETNTKIYGVKLTKQEIKDYYDYLDSPEGADKCIALAFAKFDKERLAQEPGGGLVDPDLNGNPARNKTFTIIIGVGDCAKGYIEPFKPLALVDPFYQDWNQEWP